MLLYKLFLLIKFFISFLSLFSSLPEIIVYSPPPLLPLSPLPCFLEPSAGHYSRSPPPHPSLWPAGRHESVRHKNGLTRLCAGAEAAQTDGATQADIILLTHPTSTFSNMYPDENSVPSLPCLLQRVSDLTVSLWESVQWDCSEGYLAQLCLREVKPYLGPGSNPVFSGIEVRLTASERAREGETMQGICLAESRRVGSQGAIERAEDRVKLSRCCGHCSKILL